MNASQQIADAIRKVTAAVQTALDDGRRSRVVDAYDLVDVLLAIADELDPEFLQAKATGRSPRRPTKRGR